MKAPKSAMATPWKGIFSRFQTIRLRFLARLHRHSKWSSLMGLIKCLAESTLPGPLEYQQAGVASARQLARMQPSGCGAIVKSASLISRRTGPGRSCQPFADQPAAHLAAVDGQVCERATIASSLPLSMTRTSPDQKFFQPLSRPSADRQFGIALGLKGSLSMTS